jgi:uncharacterized protein DUF3224
MKNLSLACVALLLALGGVAGDAALASPPTPTPAPAATATPKGETMTMSHASGPFEVKLAPQVNEDKGEGGSYSRLSLDKQFHGDLEATSKGEMLAAGTGTQGSAGYVAIEWVTGTLGGRSGSFALQHTGTMNRGTPQLSITVVPDSGTGQLKGLAGSMKVLIEGGKHSYDFEYTLPAAP